MDIDGDAIFDDEKSLLFVDDKQTKDEQGPGTFRSVAVWGASSRL
jgi:hypothetical protein